MHHDEKYCKNCGQHLLLDQKFCHSCGQKSDTHRINFHFLVHEIQHGIFHVDKGIFYTLKELFTRPGHSIREYLEGRRQKHFKPVLLVLILGSISALITHFVYPEEPKELSGDQQKDLVNAVGVVNEFADGKSFVEYFKNIFEWIAGHLSFMILLFIPFTSIAFYFLFKKYKINYAEWLIIMCFLAGQTLTTYSVLTLLEFFSVDLIPFFILISLGLSLWTMIQLFSSKKKLSVVIRSLFAWFFSLVLCILTTTVIFTIAFAIGLNKYGKEGVIEKLKKGETSINLEINNNVNKDSIKKDSK